MTERVQERDKAILRFIHDYRTEHGYIPSLQQIGTHFSISIAVSFKSVGRLSAAGLLLKGRPGTRRTLGITPAGLAALGVPEAVTAATESEVTVRVAYLPVLHSTETLRRWLKDNFYRVPVPAEQALAASVCEFEAIA